MIDPIVEGLKCACMEVHYNPKYNDDGTARDRWTCKQCGEEYVNVKHLENAVEQVEMLMEETHVQGVYIENLEEEMEDLDEMLDQYREEHDE